MICPQESGNTEYLLDYAAGKLNAEAQAQFESHLSVCPACHELAGGQQSVWQALDAFEVPAVSADFDHKLYARIDQLPTPWWKRLMQPVSRHAVPIGAVAGVVVLAGMFLMRPDASPVAPPIQKTAQVQTISAEQLETALDDMQMLRDFNHLVASENANQEKM